MDNAAFRSLVSNSSQDAAKPTSLNEPSTLGSRSRSSVPMTPRNVPGHNVRGELARQVAERSLSGSEPPLKKFKSTAAPKGTKLGVGYVDRAQLRKSQEGDTADEELQVSRLQNLEEQFKLGQISQIQFEKLRGQIGIGGDVESTHLVKGLDWKLLERVRKGEDVSQATSRESANQKTDASVVVDVDEELERALAREVAVSPKEATAATRSDKEQQRSMTRDDILKRFKEERSMPKASAIPALNEKFKKVPAAHTLGKKKYIESVNGRRREVLVVTNKDGSSKRKTRWIDPENVKETAQGPLGMDLPAEMAAKQKALLKEEVEEEDYSEDIFADAGDDYDPLAGIHGNSDEDDGTQPEPTKTSILAHVARRNYFSTGTINNDTDVTPDNPMTSDPTIVAALKRAAQIRKREEREESETRRHNGDLVTSEATDKSSAFLATLRERDRKDEADLDYGFGDSRHGDDDDDEDGVITVYDDQNGDKKQARKRGPKKRKGNKDDVQDVMSVIQGRKR